MTGQYCEDCGYEYSGAEPRDANGLLKCPACGGTRVGVGVHPNPVVARASLPTPGIEITTHLWLVWLRVATEHAQLALQARIDARAALDSSVRSQCMGRELQASLVAVTASAHALDALYGSAAVPQTVRDNPVGKNRRTRIREALKGLYRTGPIDNRWVGEFDRLFRLRDFVAHAGEKAKAPVPHPLGTHTAPEQVDYSAENAVWATEFAISVVQHCAHNPRPQVQTSVAWASAHRSAIDELEEQWRIEVEPLLRKAST